MEAVEQGLPEPPKPPPPPPPPPFGVDEDGFDGSEVWQQEGGEWWTAFPPPAGFDGIEEGELGAFGYKRTLSEAEQAVIEADIAGEQAEMIEEQAACRDLYFGFAGGCREGEIFSPREAETYETSGDDGT